MTFLLEKHQEIKYKYYVYETFNDIYFTDEENLWIDMVVNNIKHLRNKYKKALAYYGLFQSCIIKRPYNLFHRKNLYMRLNNVKRNFGNKTTWDTPFENHFKQFIHEANNAIFSNGRNNTSLNMDVFDINGHYDLIYIDTPYISNKGVGVDYYGFYHFLEGLVQYDKWNEIIDNNSKHKRLKNVYSIWTDKKKNSFCF